jgi:hypothetical protein
MATGSSAEFLAHLTPTALVDVTAAARWCAFRFAISEPTAMQEVGAALVQGGPQAWRRSGAGEFFPAPLTEVVRWRGEAGRVWDEASAKWQVSAERLWVRYRDVEAAVARLYFMRSETMPWPQEAPPDAWTDIPGALDQLAAAPGLWHLGRDVLLRLLVLVVGLNQVPVGSSDGVTIEPAATAGNETWGVQQGQTTDSRQTLSWVGRCVLGDPNARPGMTGPMGVGTMSWLPVQRWCTRCDVPVPIGDDQVGAIRPLILPVVHVPMVIRAICSVLADPGRLRRSGIEVPRPQTGPRRVLLTDALAALRRAPFQRSFDTSGRLRPQAAQTLRAALQDGAVPAGLVLPATPGSSQAIIDVPPSIARCLTVHQADWTASFDWASAVIIAENLSDQYDLRAAVIALGRVFGVGSDPRAPSGFALVVHGADLESLLNGLRPQSGKKGKKVTGGRVMRREVVAAIKVVSAHVDAHGFDEGKRGANYKADLIKKLMTEVEARGASIGGTQAKKHINDLLENRAAALGPAEQRSETE